MDRQQDGRAAGADGGPAAAGHFHGGDPGHHHRGPRRDARAGTLQHRSGAFRHPAVHQHGDRRQYAARRRRPDGRMQDRRHQHDADPASVVVDDAGDDRRHAAADLCP
ncbi:hypothetical protein G6F22_014377 [Rhizopus arrhizus]|nr:hypothetical protein G6F22_014377 [Rhizopus arrhizus]